MGAARRRRDELAAAHVDVVLKTARYLARRSDHVQPGDLTGTGFVALLQAAERYDQDSGASFATYARHRVRGAMLDHLRRQPEGSRPKSVEAMPWPESRDGEPLPWADPTDHQRLAEARHDAEALLSLATAKEAEALSLVYLRGLLLREAGAVMGVTESRVSQLVRSGIERVYRRATERRSRPLSLLALAALAREVDEAERPRIPPGVDLDLLAAVDVAVSRLLEERVPGDEARQDAALALGRVRIYLGAARP